MKSNFKRVKQTQKKKQKKTKSDLWGKFDNMMGKSEEESMECLYTKQQLGCRTHCDQRVQILNVGLFIRII
jgi:hypothetical protein